MNARLSHQTYHKGLDGIDLDWQYPENGTQWNWYSKLIVELGNKLKAENKILTATLRPNACYYFAIFGQLTSNTQSL